MRGDSRIASAGDAGWKIELNPKGDQSGRG